MVLSRLVYGLLASLLLLGGASTAHAVKVDVTYEVSGNIFIDYVFGGSGNESISGGTATIRYAHATTPLSAPGAFLGQARFMNMTFTVPAPTFYFYGYIPLRGDPFVLTAGLQEKGGQVGLGGPLRLPLQLAGNTRLTGLGLPTSPYDTNLGHYAVNLFATLEAVLQDLNADPAVDTWLTFHFDAFDDPATDYRYLYSGTIRLREVSRAVVPEPTTQAMFWLGLLVIAGTGSYGWRRRSVASRR